MAESDIFSQLVVLYTYVVRPLEMLYQKAWIDSEAKILPLLYWKTIPTDAGETSTTIKGDLPTVDQVDLPDRFSRCVLEYRKIPTRRSEFTIAIICALTLEADAVEALFDETYDRLGQRYGKEPGDTNAYVNGRIGQHNVVLCYMSGMGKGSAATVATNLGFSYTEIQFALIVGVCGGAPRLPADNTDGPGSTKGVFLGDVIISNAVVQYDFGRQSPDGFKRKTAVTDILGRPNQEVRSLLAGIKAKRAHQEFLENMVHHMEALRERQTRYGSILNWMMSSMTPLMHTRAPQSLIPIQSGVPASTMTLAKRRQQSQPATADVIRIRVLSFVVANNTTSTAPVYI